MLGTTTAQASIRPCTPTRARQHRTTRARSRPPDIDVNEVKWDGGKLKLKGKDAPPDATMEVLDADTRALIATLSADYGGEFELEQDLSNAPCELQMRVGGNLFGPYPVQDVPCGGSR